MVDSAFSTTANEPLPPNAGIARLRSVENVRLGARLFRLVAIYGILCYGIVLVGLALRGGREAGWGLGGALPAGTPTLDAPPLGVTVELDALDPATRRASLERLAAAGIGWVRLRVDWARVEPEQGRYQWRLTDEVIRAVTDAGLEPVVMLDGSPSWARAASDNLENDQPLAPPENPTDFAPFAEAFARRYGARVRYYQIWDEPNIAPHWGNRHIDPVGYAQLLGVASAAIRAGDADSVILTAALAPTRDRGHLAIDEPFFVQRMVAAGAAASFDALALQPFGFGASPAHSRQVIDQLDFQRTAILRRTLVAAGLEEKPIWAMRFGWNVRGDSPWGTVTPAAQVAYLADARALAARWPWLATLGWAIDKPAAPADDPIWGFALDDDLLHSLRNAPAPLPAPAPWQAAQRLALATFLCGGTLLVAAYTARGLPWVAARRRYERLSRPLEAALWIALLAAWHFATWPPLIGACWIGAALLIVARPQAGVWLALVLLPFYFQHKEVALVDGVLFVPPATAAALALLPAIALTAAARAGALRREPWRAGLKQHFLWSDALAAAWLLLNLGALRNVWQRSAYMQGIVELVVVPLILYVAIRLFMRDAQALRRALVALFAGGLLVALLGIAAWLQGRGAEIDGVRRLVGVFYSPNQTALTLLRALFVGLGLALGVHGRRRALWLALVGATSAALLLTASRGALLLGIPAGLACVIWLWLLRADAPAGEQLRGLQQRRSVRVLLMALPLVALIGLILGEARLLNVDSVDHRLLLWRASLRLWQDFPIAGVGPGGFYWRYPAYLPLGATLEPSLRHPHNVWLEMATGWGVLGLLWLAALVAAWLTSTARRLPKMPGPLQWPAIGLAAALVAALAHAQVDAFLALPELAGWLFAALALASARAWVTAAARD